MCRVCVICTFHIVERNGNGKVSPSTPVAEVGCLQKPKALGGKKGSNSVSELVFRQEIENQSITKHFGAVVEREIAGNFGR